MRKEDVINRAKLRTEENGNTEDGAELNKLLQEGAKRKADVLKKEQQLRHQVLKLQAMTHLTPLGQDRAFRFVLAFLSQFYHPPYLYPTEIVTELYIDSRISSSLS